MKDLDLPSGFDDGSFALELVQGPAGGEQCDIRGIGQLFIRDLDSHPAWALVTDSFG